MKKNSFDATVLIYAFISYFAYLAAAIFFSKSWYSSGLVLFTPTVLYSIFKIFSLKINKQSLVLGTYVSIPFGVSLFLTANNTLSGWEITGLIPVAVLTSFLFKNDDSSTPLSTVLLDRKMLFLVFAAAVISAAYFIHTGDLFKSLYLFISVYSPTILINSLLIFVNFLIETAVISSMLNNFKLFIRGGRIERIVFLSPEFLKITQLNLKGVVTAENVSKKDFMKRVELLNSALQDENGEAGKGTHAGFTYKLKDGTAFTMASLEIIKKRKGTRIDGIALPAETDGKSYVGITENKRLIGYYIVDHIDSSANTAFLKMLKEKYDVASIVVDNEESSIWRDSVEVVDHPKDLSFGANDLVVTSGEYAVDDGISLGWGNIDLKSTDVYLAEPYLLHVIKLIAISKRLKRRLNLVFLVTLAPFFIPLMASLYGIFLPELPAVAALLSVVMGLLFTFFVRKPLET